MDQVSQGWVAEIEQSERVYSNDRVLGRLRECSSLEPRVNAFPEAVRSSIIDAWRSATRSHYGDDEGYYRSRVPDPERLAALCDFVDEHLSEIVDLGAIAASALAHAVAYNGHHVLDNTWTSFGRIATTADVSEELRCAILNLTKVELANYQTTVGSDWLLTIQGSTALTLLPLVMQVAYSRCSRRDGLQAYAIRLEYLQRVLAAMYVPYPLEDIVILLDTLYRRRDKYGSAFHDSINLLPVDELELVEILATKQLRPITRFADEVARLRSVKPWELALQLAHESPEPGGPRVFVSYLHADAVEVQALVAALRFAGFSVWIDSQDLDGGVRWKAEIRRAIRDGAAMIACFSHSLAVRGRSHMNEELVLAIDEVRARPTERAWFIPVRLDACEIPERDIGGGESLRDLQAIDLFPDAVAGRARVVRALRRIVGTPHGG